jgi:hypothetical protein
MEKRSRHYGDVAKWIEKVIDSCETLQQTFAARKLIRNFSTQLMKSEPDKYWRSYQYDIIWKLDNMIHTKRDSLIKEIEK